VAEEKKKEAEVEAKVEEEPKAEAKVKAKSEAKPEAKAEAKPKGEKAKGKEAKGKEAKGEKAKGKEAKGKEAKGEKAEGKEAKGEKAEGKEAKGEKAKGKEAKGEKAKGKEAKGKEAKGGKEKGKKEAKKEAKPRPKGPADFELKYRDKCIPALTEQFKYKNPMQVPRLQKIVVNTCIKEALLDIKALETAAKEIGEITGQRPKITKAKKSIANFKLREGQSIGASVTLRGRNMWEFLSRLVNVALPRVRDFKGVPSKSFDGRGNYTMGITEQAIFPEIDVDKVARTTGMNITFVTTAETNDEGKALLKNMGMPFRNQ
jgi:large subunit ribosomal protein L5